MDLDGVNGKDELHGGPDVEWMEETADNVRREGGRLDVELRGYMSNLIKESIRVSWGRVPVSFC